LDMQYQLPDWIELTPRAQIALDTLSSHERTIVLRQISTYLDPQTFRRNRLIRKLPDFEDLYVLRATSSLRIIFRREGLLTEIIDIVNQNRLQRMYG